MSHSITNSRTYLPAAFIVGLLVLLREKYSCSNMQVRRCMPTLHGQSSLQWLHLQLEQHFWGFIKGFQVKIKDSQYIALFMVSRFIKKLSSIDWVNIYFSQSIVNYLFSIDLKMWGYPILLILSFINFKHILFLIAI